MYVSYLNYPVYRMSNTVVVIVVVVVLPQKQRLYDPEDSNGNGED